MDCQDLVNSIGIFLNIAGVFIAFISSPINQWKIDGGDANTDFAKIAKDTERKNRNLKLGIYLVLLGSFLQLLVSLKLFV